MCVPFELSGMILIHETAYENGKFRKGSSPGCVCKTVRSMVSVGCKFADVSNNIEIDAGERNMQTAICYCVCYVLNHT